MSESTKEGWSDVLASMPEKDRKKFSDWWSELPTEVVQQAANGMNWQALIAKAWRAARKE